MITVKVTKNNNQIETITINGHANFADYGKDIVCAATSSIVITTINAIESIDSKAITYNQTNNLIITIINHSDVTDKLINNMLNMLKELAHDYEENIKFL